MSIQSRIEDLRNKPEHIRRRVAFWSSFAVTAAIFSFWLASFSTLGSTNQASVTQAVTNTISPTQSLVASVGSFFGDVRDLFFGPQKVDYSEVIVERGNR